ncbi:hypothetical protein Ddye_006651 [Dipteronia dyeriana]|uniref:Uncharacterized protein n=1 Tax=Dipteronia dyeriana TaxID=168575 RepID=A0AAE0CRE0_9ROSI|nr:hypothetical protein Ddye_006651 [Dipteronia dyeriana]
MAIELKSEWQEDDIDVDSDEMLSAFQYFKWKWWWRSLLMVTDEEGGEDENNLASGR